MAWERTIDITYTEMPFIEIPEETIRVIYRSKKTMCGRKHCKSCPHGPYWYAFWEEGGKIKSKYIGKTPPFNLSTLIEPNLPKPQKSKITASDLLKSDLVGLWKDRTDIDNSIEYARLLREQTQCRNRDDTT